MSYGVEHCVRVLAFSHIRPDSESSTERATEALRHGDDYSRLRLQRHRPNDTANARTLGDHYVATTSNYVNCATASPNIRPGQQLYTSIQRRNLLPAGRVLPKFGPRRFWGGWQR
jgi:hypothetical protein